MTKWPAFTLTLLLSTSVHAMDCIDFSGHYRFQKDCMPNHEFFPPDVNSITEGRSFSSEGTFEIKQTDCNQVDLTVHTVEKKLPNGEISEFQKSDWYKLENSFSGNLSYGQETEILITPYKLKITGNEWNLFGYIFPFLSKKSTWTLKPTNEKNVYRLKVYNYDSIILMPSMRENIHCKVEKIMN